MQPHLGICPLTHDRTLRKAVHCLGLIVPDSIEEAEFDYLPFSLIKVRQLFQSFVDRDSLCAALLGDTQTIVEREGLHAAAAFGRQSTARVINQNSSHKLCSNAIEVRAILPANLSLIDELYKSF